MKKKSIPKKKAGKKKREMTVLDEETLFEMEANSKQYVMNLINKDSSLTADGQKCYDLFQDAVLEIVDRYFSKSPLHQIEYILNQAKIKPGFQLFVRKSIKAGYEKARTEEDIVKTDSGEFNPEFKKYNGLVM